MMDDVFDPSLFNLRGVQPVPPLGDDISISDPDALRFPQTASVSDPIKGEEFLAGPIRVSWLEAAAVLPGAALKVALVIRHLHTMRGRDWVVLSNCSVKRLGVSASAKARAVARLEGAGLIEVKARRAGCAPRVKPLRDR